MSQDPHAGLGAREREIFDIVVRLGEATATQVEAEISVPPSNATVRSTLRILERKGRVVRRRDGARFVYRPTSADGALKKSAARHFVQTFFSGSVADAMSALVDARSRRLSREDQKRLSEILSRIEEDDA